jgi:hypothetical protein
VKHFTNTSSPGRGYGLGDNQVGREDGMQAAAPRSRRPADELAL